MLRAYIIMSRAKEAENMLIVQPRSPHLFRQGVLPGPRLLLDVLTKKLTTTSQAKAARKEEDRKAAKEKEERAGWLSSMRPPRRICADKQTAKEKKEKQDRGEDVDARKGMKRIQFQSRPGISRARRPSTRRRFGLHEVQETTEVARAERAFHLLRWAMRTRASAPEIQPS